jgi:hypothetical protein
MSTKNACHTRPTLSLEHPNLSLLLAYPIASLLLHSFLKVFHPSGVVLFRILTIQLQLQLQIWNDLTSDVGGSLIPRLSE